MRRAATLALAATLIYPGMMILYRVAPETAIGVYLLAIHVIEWGLILSIIGFIGLAIFYPPFLEVFRRFRARLFRKVKTNWRELESDVSRLEVSPTSGLATRIASAYFEVEDYGQAAKFYEKAIELDSDLPLTAKLRLGMSLLQLKHYDRALAVLKEVYEEDKQAGAGEVMLRLGDAYRLKGDLEAARESYARFAQYSGGTPELHYSFGLLHDLEGDRAQARQRMKQAIESYRRMEPRIRNRFQLHTARARWFLIARR